MVTGGTFDPVLMEILKSPDEKQWWIADFGSGKLIHPYPITNLDESLKETLQFIVKDLTETKKQGIKLRNEMMDKIKGVFTE